MTVKIDNNLVRKLAREKPEKVREFRDDLMRGFLIRQQKSGSIAYFVSVHRGSAVRRQRRVKVGEHPITSPSEARDEAGRILAQVKLGQLPDNERVVTLGEFLDDKYLPWMRKALKAPDSQEGQLRRCFTIWRALPLNEITKHMVEIWRTKRIAEGASRGTANRNITVLRSVLSKAVEWDVLPYHPLAGLKQLRVDRNKPVRVLSDDERKRLFEAIDKRDEKLKEQRRTANEWRRIRRYNSYPELVHFGDYLKPIFLIAYHTGMRRGEILSLDWGDIDFDRKVINIRGEMSKSSQSRAIPINSVLVDVLKRWKEQTEGGIGYVFLGPNGGPIEKLRNSWNTVRKRADLLDFRFHDLRADFTSRLVNASVSLPVAQRLLGHSSPVITMKYYTAVNDDSLRSAVEKV